MRFLRDWWYARRRAQDLEFLWPMFRASTKDLASARALFRLHARRDRAWLYLGDEHMNAVIDVLE